LGVPVGGVTGNYLVKSSNNDYDTAWSSQATAFKNLVINGDMQVAQRGTSVTGITGDSYNTADRFNSFISSMGTWTQTLENDAPTGSGFRKSLKMLCTTADASPAAGDLLLIRQSIEGQNVQHILKGTSSAKQLTVSFWTKSNVTGTYIVYLNDSDNSRYISASYTISSSATWEKKTVTFAGDTTGVLDNDNAASLRLVFALGAGSDYNSGTLGTSWTTTVSTVATGQTNLAAATNNYWQITGVQLEVGSVATDYEFKPYDFELRQCQRYYEEYVYPQVAIAAGLNGNTLQVPFTFLAQKRAAPTVTLPASTNQGLNKTNGATLTPAFAWATSATVSAFHIYAGDGNIGGFVTNTAKASIEL
jgi:hypothetical protein